MPGRLSRLVDMVRIPTPTDVLKLGRAQAEAVLALPGLLVSLTQQVRLLTESLSAVQRMAIRAEALLDELEPGIRRVAAVLDDPVVDEIPATLREIQGNVLPVVRQLRDTQARIATIADATARLSSIPGAALFGARRRPLDPPLEGGRS